MATRGRRAARRAGLVLKQTFAEEGKELRRKAGGYTHAKQFRRLRKTVKRQRTILGVVMRKVQRKLDALTLADGGQPERQPSGPKALAELQISLQRAERIRTQQRHDKNNLYALPAPEVECIAKHSRQDKVTILHSCGLTQLCKMKRCCARSSRSTDR
jgi:transposase, IS5 family